MRKNNKDKQRIKQLVNYYLAKLSDLRKEHDKLLADFIRELEKERERELRLQI